MQINVIDAICGAGKTSAAINYINEAEDDKRFIYITPFLSEVDRIKKSCASKRFVEPNGASKLQDFKRHLERGDNMVTTHALFQLFDDEVIDMCQYQNYVLIMDEVANVVEPYEISSYDRDLLFQYYWRRGDNGLLYWDEPEDSPYRGIFSDEKRLTQMGCLACYGTDILMWLFPVRVFNAFSESYILTYMFDGQMQRYYYDYYGMEYRYLYVDETYHFTEEPQTYTPKHDYRKLITIIDDEKLNHIGDAPRSLSKNWYLHNKNNMMMKLLAKNTSNFFRHRLNCPTSDTIWTTFKDCRGLIKGKGYAKGFLPINARATNDYQDRHAVAYLVNRYMNPQVSRFFLTNGVKIDEDAFALSEMIQFIWRSAIRNGEPITLYIPSARMRGLLIEWLH